MNSWRLLTIIDVVPLRTFLGDGFRLVFWDLATWEPYALDLYQQATARALEREAISFIRALGGPPLDMTTLPGLHIAALIGSKKRIRKLALPAGNPASELALR